MAQVPVVVSPHLDIIQHNSNGGLFLGASSLTGRNWTGSLWYFTAEDDAPNWEKCTAGSELETGVSDLKLLKDDTLLLALDSGSVQWWQLTEGEQTFGMLAQPSEHDDLVSSLDITVDKSKAVSGAHDMRVIIWDTAECISTNTYKGHAGMIHCVACNPVNSSVFLSCGQDGLLLMWDMRKPKPARVIDISCMASIPTCAAWLPGSEHCFAVGTESGDICMMDGRTSTDKPLTFSAHNRCVHRMQFNPRIPNIVASVSDDCTVAVTDLSLEGAQHRNIYRDTRHRDFSRGVSWSPVSGKLYSSGWDTQVLAHDVNYTKTPVIMNGAQ